MVTVKKKKKPTPSQTNKSAEYGGRYFVIPVLWKVEAAELQIQTSSKKNQKNKNGVGVRRVRDTAQCKGP